MNALLINGTDDLYNLDITHRYRADQIPMMRRLIAAQILEENPDFNATNFDVIPYMPQEREEHRQREKQVPVENDGMRITQTVIIMNSV
jgi:hypothetical protein